LSAVTDRKGQSDHLASEVNQPETNEKLRRVSDSDCNGTKIMRTEFTFLSSRQHEGLFLTKKGRLLGEILGYRGGEY
jgi:hypothetical protein